MFISRCECLMDKIGYQQMFWRRLVKGICDFFGDFMRIWQELEGLREQVGVRVGYSFIKVKMILFEFMVDEVQGYISYYC